MKINLLGKNKIYILLMGILIVLSYLMMDLQIRRTNLYRLERQRKVAQTEVNAMVKTSIYLETELAYISSDAAAEDWAREEGHMALPGDIVIVPISPQEQTPTPLLIPTPTQVSVEPWAIWRELFFGE